MTKPNFKKPKPIKNKNFLNEIRQRNCIICQTFHEPQISPTTAHHVFHDRFSGEKTSDLDAIPLCEGHHQGLWDNSKIAIHKDKHGWREKYGADYTYSDKSSH